MSVNMFPLRFSALGLVLGLVSICSAAGEAQPDLTCSITRGPNHTFDYTLSKPPPSADCKTWWEDENGFNLAKDSKVDKKKVHNLTNCSITLNCCMKLSYFFECSGIRKEALCKVNCSELIELNPEQQLVNTTINCFFGSFCPAPLHVGLFISGDILLVAIILLVLCRRKVISLFKGTPAADRAEYTPAIATKMVVVRIDE